MRRAHVALIRAVKSFFDATGLPVPHIVRQVNHVLDEHFGARRRDLRKEVAALTIAVDRLETIAYLDSIGRQSN